jgi:hypothetical protein
MWIFYLAVAFFVFKFIAELSSTPVGQGPPITPPYEPPKPVYVLPKQPEPKPIKTVDEMLTYYTTLVDDPKDYLSIAMEGSGINVYPMFLTTHAAKLVKEKMEEDEGDVATAFGAWELMEVLGIEKGIMDGNGLILYENIYSVDIMTSRAVIEDHQNIEPVDDFDFDATPIGRYFAEDNDTKGYTYCLIFCVSANKRFHNHEIDFLEEVMEIPKEDSIKIEYDPENIYYNGRKMYITGDEWEYGDWWNPITLTLVKVSELKNITIGDLEF